MPEYIYSIAKISKENKIMLSQEVLDGAILQGFQLFASD